MSASKSSHKTKKPNDLTRPFSEISKLRQLDMRIAEHFYGWHHFINLSDGRIVGLPYLKGEVQEVLPYSSDEQLALRMLKDFKKRKSDYMNYYVQDFHSEQKVSYEIDGNLKIEGTKRQVSLYYNHEGGKKTLVASGEGKTFAEATALAIYMYVAELLVFIYSKLADPEEREKWFEARLKEE